MNNNQNKQDNPKVERSAEEVLSNHHILGVLNQHGLTPVVKSAMDDHAAPLHQRIAELEAKCSELESALTITKNSREFNKKLANKYREALEDIRSVKAFGRTYEIAREALNSKEVGNETKP